MNNVSLPIEDSEGLLKAIEDFFGPEIYDSIDSNETKLRNLAFYAKMLKSAQDRIKAQSQAVDKDWQPCIFCNVALVHVAEGFDTCDGCLNKVWNDNRQIIHKVHVENLLKRICQEKGPKAWPPLNRRYTYPTNIESLAKGN